MSAFVQGGSGGKNKILVLYETPQEKSMDSFNNGKTIFEGEVDLSKFNNLYLVLRVDDSGMSTFYGSIPVDKISEYSNKHLFDHGNRELLIELNGNVLRIYSGGSSTLYCYPGDYDANGMYQDGTIFFLA